MSGALLELLEKHGVYYRLWNQLPSSELVL